MTVEFNQMFSFIRWLYDRYWQHTDGNWYTWEDAWDWEPKGKPSTEIELYQKFLFENEETKRN